LPQSTTRNQTPEHLVTMSHLSELSIQLRKLQSENNAQAAEIDRLERKIRILTDTKDISINVLHDALRKACEGEAHDELRAIVGKLEARLEAMGASEGGFRKGYKAFQKGNQPQDDSPTAAAKTRDQFDKEAAARARAALELRVGELEELEQTLRGELDTLYKHVEQLTSRNTFLETQDLQQKAKLNDWERRWKLLEEDQQKNKSLVAMPSPSSGGGSSGCYNYSEFATNLGSNSKPPEPLLMLYNEPQSQLDMEQRALAAETALAGEKQQRSLLQSQKDSDKKSYELKIDQFQHRIQFQMGQLKDLEQQMSSLYAAFGIVQDERKEERNQKEEWKRNLIESDSVLAKEAYEKEVQSSCNCDAQLGVDEEHQYGEYRGRMTPKQSSKSFRGLSKSATASSPIGSSSRRGFLNYPLEASTPPEARPSLAAVKPAVDHTTIVEGQLWILVDGSLDAHSSMLNETSTQSSPFSPRKLLMKSKSSPKKMHRSPSSNPKFRRQYCVLHGTNGLYQIRYGDAYLAPVAGVLEFITTGVSSIEHTPRSYARDHGFEIMVNANDAEAPSLCCAAENEDDLMMWMAALISIIDGTNDSDIERHIRDTI